MNILIDIMNLLWGENNLVRWQVLSFFLSRFLFESRRKKRFRPRVRPEAVTHKCRKSGGISEEFLSLGLYQFSGVVRS